jgi:hypothetical protein
VLSLSLVGACGDGGGSTGDGGASTDGAVTVGDGSLADGSAPSDAALGSADGGAAPGSDAAASGADGGAAGDGGMQAMTLKLVWSGTYAAYVDASLAAFLMVATSGKTPPATVDVMVEKKCAEAGNTVLKGPAMLTGPGMTVTDYTFTFAGCKFNGLTIDGTWSVKSSIHQTMGGTETYAGDLKYGGVYVGTCPTMLKRTITPAAPTGTWEGTFCGYDVTKW